MRVGLLFSLLSSVCATPAFHSIDGEEPIAEGRADVNGLLRTLLAQREKIAPQMNTTLLEPGLKPTDTSQAARLSNSPRDHQSIKEPWTTVKTTPEAGPNRGRDGSRRLSHLLNDVVSLTLVIICTVTGLFGLVVSALCWYRLQKEVRLAQKMVYEGAQQPLPPFTDRSIAAKLQRHHYQHQKKVIQALEESKSKVKGKQMSTESEPDNEDGEYTVYECPGLAPTGEMEIHNPLFDTSILQGSSFTQQQ